MKRTRLVRACAMLSIGAAASGARADMISQTYGASPGDMTYHATSYASGSLDDVLAITPFDISLGTLTSVAIVAKGNVVAMLSGIPAPTPPGFPGPPAYGGSGTFTLSSSISLSPALTVGTVGAFIATSTSPFTAVSASRSFDTSMTITSPSALALFLSSSAPLTLQDRLSHSFSWIQTSNLNTSGVALSRSFETIITYSYTPPEPAVPEPATWALLLLGLGAMGGQMRRRGAVAPA